MLFSVYGTKNTYMVYFLRFAEIISIHAFMDI